MTKSTMMVKVTIQNAVTNCTVNALKMKPGTLSDTNQTTSFFNILTDNCDWLL